MKLEIIRDTNFFLMHDGRIIAESDDDTYLKMLKERIESDPARFPFMQKFSENR